MIFILRSGGCGGTISPEGGVRPVQKKQKATKKPSKDEQKAKKPKPPAEINTTRFPDERNLPREMQNRKSTCNLPLLVIFETIVTGR